MNENCKCSFVRRSSLHVCGKQFVHCKLGMIYLIGRYGAGMVLFVLIYNLTILQTERILMSTFWTRTSFKYIVHAYGHDFLRNF